MQLTMNAIAINSERCLWPRGYYAAPIRVCGTENYIAGSFVTLSTIAAPGCFLLLGPT